MKYTKSEDTSCLLIHPEHPTKLIWDAYLLILTLFLAYWVPFSLSFIEETPESMIKFEFAISLSYLFDMLLNFNTSYYHKGTLITNRWKICRYYLSGMFWVDAFSSFPYEWLTNPPLQNSEVSAPKYFGIMKLFRFVRMAKLLRLLKSRKIFYKIEDYILNEFISVIYAVMKIAIFLSIIAHWIACLFYYTSNSQSNSTEFTWVKFFLSGRAEDVDVFELYVTSLYWAFTTMISVGYGDITPQNPLEMTVTVSCMVLSCAYFAYIIGNMGTLVSKHLAYDQRKSEVRVGISRYLRKKDIPKKLQRKVMAFIDNLMENISSYRLRDYEVLDLLSQPLRNEILDFLYHDILNKCSIFTRYFSNDVIANLTKALQVENFSPNDVVFYEKQQSRKMYFICSGLVSIMHGSTNLVYKKLQKGEMFGEIGFFVGHNRTATAKCSDFTLLQSLDLAEALIFTDKQDDFGNIINELANSCGKHNYSVLMICCFLCDCLGHVAKDCTVEKIQSGLDSIVINYKKRKTKISKYTDSFQEPKSPMARPIYKKKVVPEKIFKNDLEMQEKIKKFMVDQSPHYKKITPESKQAIVDKILELSDEDSCD